MDDAIRKGLEADDAMGQDAAEPLRTRIAQLEAELAQSRGRAPAAPPEGEDFLLNMLANLRTFSPQVRDVASDAIQRIKMLTAALAAATARADAAQAEAERLRAYVPPLGCSVVFVTDELLPRLNEWSAPVRFKVESREDRRVMLVFQTFATPAPGPSAEDALKPLARLGLWILQSTRQGRERDGLEVQEEAERLGVVKGEVRYTYCKPGCPCDEARCGGDWTCYRDTEATVAALAALTRAPGGTT